MDSQRTCCRLMWFFHMFVKETMKTLFAPIIFTLYRAQQGTYFEIIETQFLHNLKNSKFVSFWSILSFYLLRKKILEIKNGKTLNLTTVFSLVSCNCDPQQICHTIIARPLGSSTGCTFRNTGICNYKDVKSKKTAL